MLGNIPVGIVWLCFDCLADKEKKCDLIQKNVENKVVGSNSLTNIEDDVDMDNTDSTIERRSNVNMSVNPVSDFNMQQ